MQQPVGDVLAGNAQRGAVFHQAHVVEVGHLGAADALIDPAHDIAQQPLRVVVQFRAYFVFRPVRARRQRHRQQARPARAFPPSPRPSGRRRHRPGDSAWRAASRPSAKAPRRCWRRSSMADLLVHHVAHHVRRGPHALADLRLAGKAVVQADADVALFVGGDPAEAFIAPLRIIAPACIEVWISSPVRSRKPVLMNTMRSLHRRDAGGKIDAGAAFLVHHADLDGVARQPEQVFHRIEQGIGESHFLRPVHLGLDDIDCCRCGCCGSGQGPSRRAC